MTVIALPLALQTLTGLWFLAVLRVAWRHRLLQKLTHQAMSGRRQSPGPGRGRRRRRRRSVKSSPSLIVGRAILRLARRPGDGPSGAVAASRLGRAVLLGTATVAVVSLPAGIAVGAGVWCLPFLGRLRASTDRSERLLGELPEVIDLFRLAAASGLNVTLAVAAVARRAPEIMGAGLARVVDGVALGRRLPDLLTELTGDLGEPVRPLVSVLIDSERYGTPLADALDRLATEARLQRRHRAEEAARRLPVKLIFPLVLLVLPAFALLTLAPLVASAVGGLGL